MANFPVVFRKLIVGHEYLFHCDTDKILENNTIKKSDRGLHRDEHVTGCVIHLYQTKVKHLPITTPPQIFHASYTTKC